MREVELMFGSDLKAANMAMAPPLDGLDWVMTRTERGSSSAAKQTVEQRSPVSATAMHKRRRTVHPIQRLVVSPSR
jgi:hypothetical protein